jgi:predicted nucleic acid-binding protein
MSRIAESDTVCISVLTLYETEYGMLSATPEHKERVSKAREIMRWCSKCGDPLLV